MSVQFDPKKLTRRELSEFLPTQRAIRAFEKLFDIIPLDLNEIQDNIDIIEADVDTLEANLDAHVIDFNNPHNTTKALVGLGNVTDDAQLKIASNLSDLADVPTARTNLGLASAALEEYEAGDWTPVLTDGTNDATMSGNTYGRFIRIGNMVHLEAFVETTALGSVSGAVSISGLPYNPAQSGPGAAANEGVGLAITANQNVTVKTTASSPLLPLAVWDVVTGDSAMQDTEWTADGGIKFSFTYERS